MSAGPAQVVLAYAKADRIAADTIRNALDHAGVRCVDAPGEANDKAATEVALSGSRALVVVHSRAAGTDRALLRVVEAAARRRLPLIPVRLDADKPAPGLAVFLREAPWFEVPAGMLAGRLAPLVARVKLAAGLPLGDAELVDDGEGGIDLWAVERRRVHRGWWLVAAAVAVVVAVLAWRAYDRYAAERAFEAGVARLATGDLAGAAAQFDAALARRPDWAAAWRQRGFASEESAAQIAAFSRAVQLDATDADAYAGRGRARAQAGDYRGAVADFDAALALAPDSAAWHGERGLLRMLLAEDAGAQADFARCAQLDPQCGETFSPRIAAAEEALNRPPQQWFGAP
jgi:hypothetical protein